MKSWIEKITRNNRTAPRFDRRESSCSLSASVAGNASSLAAPKIFFQYELISFRILQII
ncbi:MAG: hypothetical protein M0R34_07300 [Candidatus Marinimicrobia bacterium]|jgi:hypothetical protein|nr:hypothetical protein [Candidatus Neomarinimicrobiota bacterium]MCK9560666.1 hypothetical protein [Candidatus Neomarinimicrobiota bacterium]